MTSLVLARSLGRNGTGRTTRIRADLSVRELAQIVGVDVATLSRWERGEARPRPRAAARWVEACDTIERLLDSTLNRDPRADQLPLGDRAKSPDTRTPSAFTEGVPTPNPSQSQVDPIIPAGDSNEEAPADVSPP